MSDLDLLRWTGILVPGLCDKLGLRHEAESKKFGPKLALNSVIIAFW